MKNLVFVVVALLVVVMILGCSGSGDKVATGSSMGVPGPSGSVEVTAQEARAVEAALAGNREAAQVAESGLQNASGVMSVTPSSGGNADSESGAVQTPSTADSSAGDGAVKEAAPADKTDATPAENQQSDTPKESMPPAEKEMGDPPKEGPSPTEADKPATGSADKPAEDDSKKDEEKKEEKKE